MKFTNFSIPVLRDAMSSAMSRFPMALISAFACGLISIYLVELKDKAPELQRIFFSLAIGLPWLTGLHLLLAGHIKPVSQKLMISFIGIAFLLLIFIFIAPDFDDDRLERPVRFFSFFLISHLLVSLAPFIKSGNLKAFWEYNKDAFVIWYIGAFYALIIYLGLAIALVAIDNLFDIKIGYQLYFDIFIIIVAGFHPVYVLSNFPQADQVGLHSVSHTKAIRNLCFYILMPLTILYFLILYAYGFKIVSSGVLPRGWVSSLVLGFSGIGMISYLLNYLLPHLEDSKLSSLYKKYFFYILAPLVILLFVAINRRISDYGFTPPRYFVLITGFWLFLSCIYFIFSKSNNIKLIPMSLIVFLLVGTISPFDAFHTSTGSQYNRLVTLLEKNKALENGKIKSSLTSLDPAEKESIKNIIYALDKMGALKKVNGLLLDPISFDTIVYNDPRDFLFEKTGLSTSVQNTNYPKTIYLSTSERNDFSISGYEQMFIFNLYKGGTDENINLEEIHGSSIIICKKLQDTIPLNDLLQTINKKYQESGPNSILDAPFDIDTKLHKHRLYIKNINYQKTESTLSIDYMQVVLLVGKK